MGILKLIAFLAVSVPIYIFWVKRLWNPNEEFVRNLITAGLATMFTLAAIGGILYVAASYWYIAALVIGGITYAVTKNQQTALGIGILSAIVLFVGSFFIDNIDKKSTTTIRQEQTRQEKREKQRKEREDEDDGQVQEENPQRKEEQPKQDIQQQQNAAQEQAINACATVFKDYQRAIIEHKFTDAYAKLSPKEKNHQGTSEQFAAGRKDVIEIEILKFEPTYSAAEPRVYANYRIKVKDITESGIIEKIFDGNAEFIKNPDGWLIDALSSKKIDPTMDSNDHM